MRTKVHVCITVPGAGSAVRLPMTVCPPDSKSRDGFPSPHDGFRHRDEAHRYPSQHHRAHQAAATATRSRE